jgi:hypothetical protein
MMLYVTDFDTSDTNDVGSYCVPIHVRDSEKDYAILKKRKRSTIKRHKSSRHYGSSGECFSFGLRNV